ncbi:MAG: hypothetical protein ABI615_09085 [Chthoniobacterales bacterium]
MTVPVTLFAAPLSAPDTIVLKDGTVIHGLIVQNTRNSVTIQEKYEEQTYLKSQITRIRDEADLGTTITNVERKSSLPPWRLIANDLRSDDSVKYFEEIPATVVDVGPFKNVPYISFRINSNIELDIFGNPDHPAGISVGIYGSRSGNARLQRICREFVAGYLTTRAEIAALYSLDKKGGVKDAEDMTLEITPPDAPDAYGAWWVSVYNKKALNKERLKDSEYAKLTTSVSSVVNNKGEVYPNVWSREEIKESYRASAGSGKNSKIYARGFYRDADGVFHIIPAQQKTSQ